MQEKNAKSQKKHKKDINAKKNSKFQIVNVPGKREKTKNQRTTKSTKIAKKRNYPKITKKTKNYQNARKN